MWFQTLKAKQGIRHFITSNSKGQAAAIEYNDKKVEVHLLKREAMPLLLDEGCHVAFLSHKSSAMTLVSLSLSLKNSKVQLDFKTWDMIGVLGFTPKDILVEDMNKCYVSDGKFKGAVTLPEQHCSPSSTIKVDSCGECLAVAIDISLVLLWKVKKADVSTITMTLEGVLKSQMAIHSLCLLPEPTNNQDQNISRCPNDAMKRQISEAEYIRALDPQLNSKDEWASSQTTKSKKRLQSVLA